MSLADTRLATLLFPLLSGLVFEESSRVRLASGLHRYYCRLLSRGLRLSKGAGLDVEVERLRGVCGGGRGGPEWL